jgi:hypothetical protein
LLVWFLLLLNFYVSGTKWQPTFDEFVVGAVWDVWVYVYLCVVLQTPDVSNCVHNYCYTTSATLVACTSKEEAVM